MLAHPYSVCSICFHLYAVIAEEAGVEIHFPFGVHCGFGHKAEGCKFLLHALFYQRLCGWEVWDSTSQPER